MRSAPTASASSVASVTLTLAEKREQMQSISSSLLRVARFLAAAEEGVPPLRATGRCVLPGEGDRSVLLEVLISERRPGFAPFLLLRRTMAAPFFFEGTTSVTKAPPSVAEYVTVLRVAGRLVDLAGEKDMVAMVTIVLQLCDLARWGIYELCGSCFMWRVRGSAVQRLGEVNENGCGNQFWRNCERAERADRSFSCKSPRFFEPRIHVSVDTHTTLVTHTNPRQLPTNLQ
mmetsp:Transcript_14327/g.30807  ORF Transcript_14327/g.30807 Transcript_14327/m.30807 type:complete len:231 (+) Transcript_14327:2964-3656(+)